LMPIYFHFIRRIFIDVTMPLTHSPIEPLALLDDGRCEGSF